MRHKKSSRDEEELLPRAFAVAGELGPEAGPPTNGLDYLRRVRWEAKRCPGVVVSTEIDPRDFADKQTRFVSLPPAFAPTPPGLAPSSSWEEKFVASFAVFHQELDEYYKMYKQYYTRTGNAPTLPSISDAQRWKSFCLRAHLGEPSDSACGNPPTLQIVMQLDQVAVIRLVEYHVKWVEKSEQISDIQKEWLFALLGRLDKPLDSDTASSLRSLLRRLTHERAKLSLPTDPQLPSLNILIVIIGIFFGQRGPDDT